MASLNSIRVWLATFSICLLCAHTAFGATGGIVDGNRHDDIGRETRVIEIREAVARTVRDLDQKLATLDATPTIRDLTNSALAKLELGALPDEAELLLKRALSKQNIDSTSPLFGKLPWQEQHPEILDENAIEFGMQAIGVILRHHRDRFSKEFLSDVTEHVKAGIYAIRKHVVPVTYTNIFLMKTVNLILLGEGISDDSAAGEGYAMLDDWMTYTRTNGIHEYDSPTYYGVDLNCLNLGFRFCNSLEGKSHFKSALDFIWTDICANTFLSRGKLAGAHSRDFDFLRGTGGVDVYLYLEGLRKENTADRLDLEKACLLATWDDKSYHPDSKILAYANAPERIVEQRWDEAPDSDKYSYLTRNFSIGTASGYFGPQDKPFSINFATDMDLPDITLVASANDQPYGKIKVKGKDGHSKPVHLPLNMVSVQNKGMALLWVDLDPSKAAVGEGLTTNLIFPAKVDSLIVDGAWVSTASEMRRGFRRNAVLGMSEGVDGFAIRIVHVDGLGGKEPNIELVADNMGLKYGAARLAFTHTRTAIAASKYKHLKVLLLVVAEELSESKKLQDLIQRVRSATIVENTVGTTLDVTVKMGEVTLGIARDVLTRTTVSRKVNDTPLLQHVLAVNGVELATDLLPLRKANP